MCSTIRNIIKYYEILNNANITYKNIDSVHSKIYNNIINNYVLHASYLASIKPITNSSNFRDLIANVHLIKKIMKDSKTVNLFQYLYRKPFRYN